MTVKNQKIRIRLRAFDHKLLDGAVRDIIETAKRSGARVKGPILLPTKKKRTTVTISPHVDANAREHFQLCVYKRVLDIIEAVDKTINALMKLALSPGIDVQIVLLAYDGAHKAQVKPKADKKK